MEVLWRELAKRFDRRLAHACINVLELGDEDCMHCQALWARELEESLHRWRCHAHACIRVFELGGEGGRENLGFKLVESRHHRIVHAYIRGPDLGGERG
eukprot:1531120-Prymnesium_polylepis.1